ncbi:hypothetical protein LHP98_10965 [Rhodobacter sp. Har01]|uniref:hypothetical protein n=1 Tax=Rhodobacter sp. Har01 TaxID=2883999 RepID=UPI001D0818D0|nr:hypothetical protein [Rhodobacter sp. Har01]MCB6178648.1 hypothetical protein [Rhodobacter sp. Har01]
MVRGPVSLAIVGLIMLAMLALVAGGPRVFEKVLPESAIVWLETFGGEPGMVSADGGWAGSPDGGGDASSNPLDYLSDTSEGWEANGPIAAAAGGGAVFIDAAFADYRKRGNGEAAAKAETLEPLAGCAPTPPSATAFLAHVRASVSSSIPLDLATYDDADLAAAAQAFARTLRTTGTKRKPLLAGVVFTAYDVAVTETERPVYLVLEVPQGLRILNLHLAPGAKLERVVLLGGEQAGVANLPEGVPVEVMRDAEMEACGLRPFYPLNPNHLFFQSVENGAIQGEELETRLAEFARLEAEWDAAFRAMFGAGAAETLIGGWDEGTLALAGPVPATPEARAVWTPYAGATVRMTVDQYVHHPGLEAEGADFASKVEAIATAFAWGDLKNLKPGVKF